MAIIGRRINLFSLKKRMRGQDNATLDIIIDLKNIIRHIIHFYDFKDVKYSI